MFLSLINKAHFAPLRCYCHNIPGKENDVITHMDYISLFAVFTLYQMSV